MNGHERATMRIAITRQAEKSFEIGRQAGRKEVVEWVNKNWLDQSNMKQWQAKLKDWGIKEETK